MDSLIMYNHKIMQSSTIQRWPQYILDELIEVTRVLPRHGLYAVGSRVYDDYRPKSDLDLYITHHSDELGVKINHFQFYGISCRIDYDIPYDITNRTDGVRLDLPNFNIKTGELYKGNPDHIAYRIYQKELKDKYGGNRDHHLPVKLETFLKQK